MVFRKLKYVPASDLIELLNDFETIMKKCSYSKNQILHEKGSVCDHLYIVEQGIARSFYNKDGKDITTHFAVEQGTITAIDSFIQRKKSRYTIEALEDSTIISISHQDIQTLLEKKPKYERYIRLFLEQIYIDLAEHVEDLVFHNAKERYNKLVKTTPDILQRVNLKHIASYIGITQEALNKLRS